MMYEATYKLLELLYDYVIDQLDGQLAAEGDPGIKRGICEHQRKLDALLEKVEAELKGGESHAEPA